MLGHCKTDFGKWVGMRNTIPTKSTKGKNKHEKKTKVVISEKGTLRNQYCLLLNV